MRTGEVPSGVLVVDKPAGPTSHDIVARTRSLLKIKVGHTGTLDPMATGVLPLVLGRATRLSRFFQSSDKEYVAEIRLGKTTDTFDGEGKVIEEKPLPRISPRQSKQVLAQFTGVIQQQAPMFSAVKVAGQKLYELARRKRESERPWRTVHVYRLELLEQTEAIWSLRVHCSSGTYIRALAHEIGEALSCGAYLQNLRRIRSGTFDLYRAIPVDEIEHDWRKVLYPMEELLPELPRIDLHEQQAERVHHGNEIPRETEFAGEFCRLFHNEKLIAIGRAAPRNHIRPTIVLETKNREK